MRCTAQGWFRSSGGERGHAGHAGGRPGRRSRRFALTKDQFYGDRAGIIQDPFNHRWFIHTHIKDVSPSEMESGMQQAAQTA